MRRIRDAGETEFAMFRGGHLAAELLCHGLHSVADAEHRNSGLVDELGGQRRLGVGDGLWPARQDDPAGLERADLGLARIPGKDLAINADLAHATCDQLRVLRAEVENQDAVGVDVRGGGCDGLQQLGGHSQLTR